MILADTGFEGAAPAPRLDSHSANRDNSGVRNRTARIGFPPFAYLKVLMVAEGFRAMTGVGRPNSPIVMAVIDSIDQIDLLSGVS